MHERLLHRAALCPFRIGLYPFTAPLLIASIVVAALAGCGDDSSGVGIDFVDDTNEVAIVDTFTVYASTVFTDSIATQGASQVLAGSYQDERLGTTRARAYLQFSLSTDAFAAPDEATYDSLVLHLSVGYRYGAEDEQQTLRAHRVTETIEPTEEGDPLFNVDQFAFDPKPLGEETFDPDADRRVGIAISDDLGQALFEAAQDESDIVSDNEEFQEFLSGIVLAGDETETSAVTGFSAGGQTDQAGGQGGQADGGRPVLRLHYTDIDEDGFAEEAQYDFVVSGAYFSEIWSEPPVPLSELNDTGEMVPAAQTNDQAYIQSGVGMMTRIEFPTLRDFLFIDPDIILVSADLFLQPVAGTYQEPTPLVQPLAAFVAEDDNDILGGLVDQDGNALAVTPSIDDEFNQETFYRIDVTAFVQDELDAGFDTDRGLLFAPADSVFARTVDRAVLGGGENAAFRPVLRITYITL